jgi:UDP-glucose 4-epimerase
MILITGGMGYIGSHTVVELLNLGKEIVVVDDYSNSKPEVYHRIQKITGKSFPVYAVNCCDSERMQDIFESHAIQSVIHFAGYKAVGESVAKPLMYYHNNINSTLVLLALMAKYGVHEFVFSSSATVYGDPKRVPIIEDSPLWCTNPYGRTKLMNEEIIRDAHKANPHLRVAILRYFNPIGAHVSGLIGEDPNGIPNNLMPYITQVAVGKRESLSIFGKDYPTLDGTGVRDYIHVVDLALGHIAAIDYLKKNRGLSAFNLGTGVGYSVLDVVHAFEKASGSIIPYTFAPRRPGDIATCYADVNYARKNLAWEAKFDINRMCVDAWRWQSQNPNGYEPIIR